MNAKLYHRQLFKQYRPYLLLVLVLALADPIISFFSARMSLAEGMAAKYVASGFFHASLYLPILSIFLGLLVPFVVLSFLYKKSDMDLYASLPIRSERLLDHHFLFGWCGMILLPLGLSYLLKFLLGLALFGPQASFQILSLGQFVDLGLFLLVGSFLFTLPALLSLLTTTNPLNGVLIALAFQMVLPAIFSQVLHFQSTLLGNLSYLSNRGEAPFYYLCPHYCYLMPFARLSLSPKLLIALSVWSLIGLLLYFLCRSLVKRRPVERIGSSSMFRAFYPVCIAIFGLIGLTLLNMSLVPGMTWSALEHWNFFAFPAILGLVALLVVQITRYRGRPPILKTILAYVLLFICSLACTFAITGPIKTKAEMTLPAPQAVDRLLLVNPIRSNALVVRMRESDQFLDDMGLDEASFIQMAHDHLLSSYLLINEGGRERPRRRDELPKLPYHRQVQTLSLMDQTHYYQEAVFHQKDEIEHLQALQKKLVAYYQKMQREHSQEPGDQYSTGRIQFSYLDKNGKPLQVRTYDIPRAILREELAALFPEGLFSVEGLPLSASRP